MSEAPLLVNADGSPAIDQLMEHLVEGAEVWEREKKLLDSRIAALVDENHALVDENHALSVRTKSAETRVAVLETELTFTFAQRLRRRLTFSRDR